MHNRIFLITVFYFLSVTLVLSQKSETDSLKSLLASTVNIAEKHDILLSLARKLKESDFNESIFYVDQAVELADNLGKPLLKANSLLLKAEIYDYHRKTQDAVGFAAQALSIYESSGDKKGICHTSNNLSGFNYLLYNGDEAIRDAERALQAATELKADTLQADAYFNMGNGYYRNNDYNKALEYHEKSLQIAEEISDKRRIGKSAHRLGILRFDTGEFQRSVEHYQRAIEIRKVLNDDLGAAYSLANMANAYTQLGKYEEAISSYKEAGDYFRENGHKRGTANTLLGMAAIYETLKEYTTALEALQEYLNIYIEVNSPRDIANAYNNLGILHNNMLADSLRTLYGNDFQDSIYLQKIKVEIPAAKEAMKYHTLALEKRREINDTREIGASLLNLGSTYFTVNDFVRAREIYQEWLSLSDVIANDDQSSSINQALGKIYKAEGDIDKAIEYYYTALKYARKISKRVYLKDISEELAELHERKGNYKRAYEYHRMFSSYKDSLFTDESRRIIHEMQVKYETDAKEKENQLLRKDQLISDAKLKQQKYTIYFFIFVIAGVIAFVVMLIRQNAARKRANLELERRNKLITEQKKEITDSIQYASRIQNAILPPAELINKYLPERFIIYRPRDIVSGDFYWLTEKNNRITIMIADCTGHGVPGAFMSMLGIAFLNEIVSKKSDLSAGDILNELRNHVIHSLHQTGREGESQDGMDVALMILDKNKMTVEFAGANNPLFIYRNSELIELKADKMPIGIHIRVEQPFTNQIENIRKGDMLYAFSDGFPDQFGGPDGKKFMIKNFKKVLEEIHLKPMTEQKARLDETLDNWMANTNQIDDILVMGIRIN